MNHNQESFKILSTNVKPIESIDNLCIINKESYKNIRSLKEKFLKFVDDYSKLKSKISSQNKIISELKSELTTQNSIISIQNKTINELNSELSTKAKIIDDLTHILCQNKNIYELQTIR